MTISFLFVSLSAHAQIATLDGNWHSPQWKYGYVLKDGMGIATSTNSPNFRVGQNIIQLSATSPNTFTGQQVYTDGKFYKVTVTLLADGRLSFEGEKNVKWIMERIGVPPLTSSSATQTTAPAPSATANSPSFDCRKATTTVEKLVCNSPELSKLDVSLAEMYKEAVSKAPSIRDDQRSWNGEKNKCADVECLKTAYEDRISQLVNLIVRHDRAALNQGQTSASAFNQGNERTASRSNQNNSDINSGSTQKNNDARDEAAASLGICAGALKISNSADPYVQKVSAKIEGEVKRHDALFKSACGQNPQLGPALTACLESLPRETLIFLNARGMAVSEMRSSKPLSFMKNNMQGNNPTVHGIVKMAHCPSTM
jgi:uncharacterized protein